jgi:hypothetical protein
MCDAVAQVKKQIASSPLLHHHIVPVSVQRLRFAITWSHAQKTIATVFIPPYETVCSKLEVSCGTDLSTPKLAEQTLISQLLSLAKPILLYCNRVFAATRRYFVTCKSIPINSATLCNGSQSYWKQQWNMWNPQLKSAEMVKNIR